MGRIAPNYYVQDSVIPRTRLPEVLRRIEELAEEYGLRVANVFHAGDGNLHPLVLYDGANEGEPERAEELAGLIVKACVDAGGSITGEHGVGVDKKRYMPSMFGEPDLATFQRLRCAFDPDGLRQPGQGDADPAAVRRGARPVPASTRWRRPAWRSASRPWARDTVARETPDYREDAAELLRGCAERGPPCARWRRDEARLGQRSATRSSVELSTAGLDRHHRAQRRRPHRRRRRRRAAGASSRSGSPPPARCSRSTRRARRTAAATIGGIVATATRARCATATAPPRDLVRRDDGRALRRHRRAGRAAR